ncbi:MAG TPA: LptF/LptG family permease [Phycisphaerae bacterium]|nr:LptF/LptG family permease [Phycisphaerae bacterium]
MRTLHLYFGRELLKTFLMTAAALTMLIVMGGGVANIFRAEGIGAEQMFSIFLYLTPVAITLILPVAALFSATITYGRAATDNEVLACQAAGINSHRLLLPPLLLGLLVTGATYFSWNYVIPMLTAKIADVSRRDLPAIVLGQFLKSKPLVYGKYRISAKQCEKVPVEQLPAEYRDGHTYLRLTGVAFMEVEEMNYTRFGTADETIIDFDATHPAPQVTIQMEGVRVFDASRKQFYDMQSQRMGPREIPLPIARKIKFENLETLKEWLREPRQIPEIIDLTHGLEREMMVFFLNQVLYEAIEKDGRFVLHDRKYTIEIAPGRYTTDEEDGRLRLADVNARVSYLGGDKPDDVYYASDAAIELRTSFTTNRPTIAVELAGEVTLTRDPMGPDDQIVKKPKETLPLVDFRRQTEMQTRFTSFDFKRLFEATSPVPLHEKQERMRKKVRDRVQRFQAELRSEIEFRKSYALDAVAIVLLGAMLGIIVRGGQVLTAFGISCLPMLIVIIASVVGRNLADKPGYELASIGTMWGATIFMYLATIIVAFKGLRR